MKKNNTIRIKNELPELLEAVCAHEDCPLWLKNDIWDSFNNKDRREISFDANHWRSILESGVPMEDSRDIGTCFTEGCGNEDAYYNYCLDCWGKQIAKKRAGDWPEVVQ